jgi:hypothetical protein
MFCSLEKLRSKSYCSLIVIFLLPTITLLMDWQLPDHKKSKKQQQAKACFINDLQKIY